MDDTTTWLATLATLAVLAAYELAQLALHLRRPGALAPTMHANLREDWFVSISRKAGTEILAVQTLRNSLMSATMIASTAVLGLMGAATLTAPVVRELVAGGALGGPSPLSARLTLDLVLMLLLLLSLVASAMSMRYFNHAGFIAGMPTDSDARARWSAAGVRYLRRAGLMYGWGLRHLVMVAPVLVAMLRPVAGPVAAVLVVCGLIVLDRADQLA